MADPWHAAPAPGGTGCVDFDSSPNQHATAHAEHSGHPTIQSLEPVEDWFYNCGIGRAFTGPPLPPPHLASPRPAVAGTRRPRSSGPAAPEELTPVVEMSARTPRRPRR